MAYSYSSRQPKGFTFPSTRVLGSGTKANQRNCPGYTSGPARNCPGPYAQTRTQGLPNRIPGTEHNRSRGRAQTFPPSNQGPKTPYRRDINGVTYEIRTGSIVKYDGTAIVNAANEQGLGGGGVDGAITAAGGNLLRIARTNMSNIWGDIKIRTGDARTTISGQMPCKYVIHAVGPNLALEKYSLKHLTAAYTSVVSEAYRYDMKDVAFPIISGGVFSGGYTQRSIIKTGFDALVGKERGLKKIVFYGFTQQESQSLIQVLESVQVPQCNT